MSRILPWSLVLLVLAAFLPLCAPPDPAPVHAAPAGSDGAGPAPLAPRPLPDHVSAAVPPREERASLASDDGFVRWWPALSEVTSRPAEDGVTRLVVSVLGPSQPRLSPVLSLWRSDDLDGGVRTGAFRYVAMGSENEAGEVRFAKSVAKRGRGLEPGSYRIQILGQAFPKDACFEVHESQEHRATLDLRAFSWISVRLTDHGAALDAGCRPRLELLDPRGRSVWMRRGSCLRADGDGMGGPAGDYSLVRIPPVPPGRYTLVAQQSTLAPRRRQRVALRSGRESLAVRFSGGGVRLQLRADTRINYRLRCAAVRIEDLPSQRLQPIRSASRARRLPDYRTDHSSLDGRSVRFYDMEPGVYRFVVHAGSTGYWFSEPTRIDDGAQRVVAGRLEEGGSLSISLEGWPGEQIRRRFFHLVRLDDGWSFLTTVDSRRKQLRERHLPPGRYQLAWNRPGRQALSGFSDPFDLAGTGDHVLHVPPPADP